MKIPNNCKSIFRALLNKSMDGQITVEEIQQFNTLLCTYPELKDYYYKCVQLQFALSEVPIVCNFASIEKMDIKKSAGEEEEKKKQEKEEEKQEKEEEDYFEIADTFMEAMRQLALCEDSAVEVVVEKPEDKQELIQKIDHSNYKFFAGKGNKPLLLFALAMAACFMVMLGHVYFLPDPSVLPVVAELVDSIGAKWDDDMQLPDNNSYGYGRMRQSTYRLTAGFVSIRFLGGAKITIEAPAEWSLLGGGNMELFHGRIYAVVPKEAHGFTVMAGNSKIVDLGTEFGIEVDNKNNTRLHVTKGKTLLFSGLKTGQKSSIQVNEGAAKKVTSDGCVKDIDIASKHFVRDINTPYTTLSVLNASFETLASNRNLWISNNNVAVWDTPPWTTQFKQVGTNIWEPDLSPNGGAVTINAEYGYGGIAADGKYIGFIKTDPRSDHCLYQKLAFSLQSSRTYGLSVKVGNPSALNNGNAVPYRIELLAGNVVIASDSGASPNSDSEWITVRVSYTSGPDRASDPNIGQPLAIRLIAKAFTENKHLNFDDVQILIKAGTGKD